MSRQLDALDCRSVIAHRGINTYNSSMLPDSITRNQFRENQENYSVLYYSSMYISQRAPSIIIYLKCVLILIHILNI